MSHIQRLLKCLLTQRLCKFRANSRLDQLVTSRPRLERLEPTDMGMEIPRNRAVKVQRRMTPNFGGIFRRKDSRWPVIRDEAEDISLWWLVGGNHGTK